MIERGEAAPLSTELGKLAGVPDTQVRHAAHVRTGRPPRTKSGPHERVQYTLGWLGRAGPSSVPNVFTE